MLTNSPHSLLASRVLAKRSAKSDQLSFVGNLTSLIALSIFSFTSTLVNLMIMCLGVALRSIFVVFSVYLEFEYWLALLGWGSYPGLYPEECFPT